MSVNVTDIQDYLDWKIQQNLSGVRDSVQDFAVHREQLDQNARVEETIEFLKDLVAYYDDGETISSSEIKVAIELLTGVDYEPDDV